MIGFEETVSELRWNVLLKLRFHLTDLPSIGRRDRNNQSIYFRKVA